MTTPDNARCALCNQSLDRESPFSIYGRNPRTFRYAWMHDFCAVNAFEALRGQPSKRAEYDNRQDEYIQRFEDDEN
jgi:hypothetical protein